MHHDSSSPVTRLLAESLAGHVSRRDILKRASALGLSAPVVGILLSAQSRGALAQDATPAGESGGVGSTITVPEGLPTDLGGASITVIFGADGPSTPWEEAAIAKFTEATGINVTLTVGPTSATERLALYQQLLAAQATDADAMMIDIIWPGILAAHAVDLSEAIGWQDGDYFERLVENNTVNGVLVGIPWYTDAGLLYYRTDLLEKHGFEGPPVTWTELEEMATAIQEAERADNPDFQGYVWQGAAYEGLTCDGLEWQFSNGGGTIVEPDGAVSVNNPQAISMFERARGWVGTISPQGVTTYMEEEARGVWQAGNAAFMRNWPYAYAPGQEEGSAIQGAFDVTQIPMGDGDGATHAATLGGWQVMVSRYSQNQPAAIAWAQYLTSRELQKSYAVELSRLPTIPSLYEDADVLEANPFFERLLPVFEGGSVARPSTVTADLYNQVSTAYFTALNEILTGQAADAAARVEQLAQQLDGIVSQL
ncbi:MAG: transporter substrate-binding protein [Thermomicrobiales bacterium]|jgi:trehalose/maltose transport system substrate-binding protein|nr:transporter substrate-binding protein [Thermomicrobiales bacterium]